MLKEAHRLSYQGGKEFSAPVSEEGSDSPEGGNHFRSIDRFPIYHQGGRFSPPFQEGHGILTVIAGSLDKLIKDFSFCFPVRLTVTGSLSIGEGVFLLQS